MKILWVGEMQRYQKERRKMGESCELERKLMIMTESGIKRNNDSFSSFLDSYHPLIDSSWLSLQFTLHILHLKNSFHTFLSLSLSLVLFSLSLVLSTYYLEFLSSFQISHSFSSDSSTPDSIPSQSIQPQTGDHNYPIWWRKKQKIESQREREKER